MDVRTALQRFLRYHRTAGSSPATIRLYDRYVSEFAAYLERQHHSGEIEDLRPDDLRGWLEECRDVGAPQPDPRKARKPNAQTTVKQKAIHVKAFAAWLGDPEEGYLPKDPFRAVKRPKADDVAKDPLAPGEVEKLLAAIDRNTPTGPRNLAMLLILYSTGVRASELVGIRVEDLDHDQGQIVIRRGKGGKFRIVPLTPKVERAIDKYLGGRHRKQHGRAGALFRNLDGSPITSETLTHMLIRLEAKTGIRCNPHRWRYSNAIQYLRSGGRIETLQKLLGHTTLTMSLHYARVAGVDVTTAHETADPVRSLKTRI